MLCDTQQCLPDEEHAARVQQLHERGIPTHSVPCVSAPPVRRIERVANNVSTQLLRAPPPMPGANEGEVCNTSVADTADPIRCAATMTCVAAYEEGGDTGACQKCAPTYSQHNECLFTLPESAVRTCAIRHELDPDRVVGFEEYGGLDPSSVSWRERRFYDDLRATLPSLDREHRSIAECVLHREQGDSGCCDDYACSPHITSPLLVETNGHHLPGTCVSKSSGL